MWYRPHNITAFPSSFASSRSSSSTNETQSSAFGTNNLSIRDAPITPLSIAHLLDFEDRLHRREKKGTSGGATTSAHGSDGDDDHEEGGLTEDIVEYLCEQAAVRVLKSTDILDRLPENLREQGHIDDLRRHYEKCIEGIEAVCGVGGTEGGNYVNEVPSTTLRQVAAIVDKAARGKRLGFDMMCIARAIRSLSVLEGPDAYFGSELQRSIDDVVHDFNDIRIGIRLLSDMYTRASDTNTSPFSAIGRGILHKNVSVLDEVERATAFVESVAVENLYMCPEMIVNHQGDTHIPYVPAHIWYIVVEILKNAVVAVVDHHSGSGGGGGSTNKAIGATLPPIDVHINSTIHRTSISVVDRGGGLGPSNSVGKAMAYCFTTGTRPAGNDLSGAGIGLPMAHAYAEYFGGSLDFQSEDGVGCTVNIALNHHKAAVEPLVS
eukprot:g753.t1